MSKKVFFDIDIQYDFLQPVNKPEVHHVDDIWPPHCIVSKKQYEAEDAEFEEVFDAEISIHSPEPSTKSMSLAGRSKLLLDKLPVSKSTSTK